MTIYTEAEIINVMLLRGQGKSYNEIAKVTDISKTALWRLVKNYNERQQRL